MTLFKRIKQLSTESGKNVKDVAIELGYGENYFYSFNSGKKPSSDKLEEIADYFDISVDYLLGRTDKKRYYDLTEKDELAILKKIFDGEDIDSAFAIFDGSNLEKLNEEDKKLLFASWENTLRLTKYIVNQKLTPKN